jgi:hypothetical protein
MVVKVGLSPCLEHRLRVFENRALRRTYGPKREEVTGECRKLQTLMRNFTTSYCSPDISKLLYRRGG